MKISWESQFKFTFPTRHLWLSDINECLSRLSEARIILSGEWDLKSLKWLLFYECMNVSVRGWKSCLQVFDCTFRFSLTLTNLFESKLMKRSKIEGEHRAKFSCCWRKLWNWLIVQVELLCCRFELRNCERYDSTRFS